MEPAQAQAKPASQKIAMTAPVALEPFPETVLASVKPPVLQRANRWRVHFVMPSAYTLATLPKPNNASVQLREVPAKTWAVLSYTGFNTEAGKQQRTDELLAWLEERNIPITGSPQLSRYNPPWTLPMLRRNEVIIEFTQ